jgi:putative copper export protein
LPERGGVVTRVGISTITKVALIWVISSAVTIFLSLREIIGGEFDSTTMRSFLTQTGLGRTLAIQLVASLLVLLLLGRIRRGGGALALLLISLVALIAPFFESHSGDAGMHGLAIGSILFHIGAIALWIGGLVSLFFVDGSMRALVLPRFSAIALWLSVIVIVTGVANSWTRMNFIDAWGSTYSLILIFKVTLVIALIVLASYLRRSFATRGLSNPLIRWKLALADRATTTR